MSSSDITIDIPLKESDGGGDFSVPSGHVSSRRSFFLEQQQIAGSQTEPAAATSGGRSPSPNPAKKSPQQREKTEPSIGKRDSGREDKPKNLDTDRLKEDARTQSRLKRISRSFRNGRADVGSHESRKSRVDELSIDDAPSSPSHSSPNSSPSLQTPESSLSHSQSSRSMSKAQATPKFKVKDKFCVEDKDENIIFEEEEETAIRAATVEKLVQRVTFEGHPDVKLVEDFLLTYRSFITPQRLMELLEERYNSKCWNNHELTSVERKEFETKFLKPVRLRIFNLCKNWVKFYNSDFTDDPKLAKDFEKWMRELFDNSKMIDPLLKELKAIIKVAKEKKEKEAGGDEEKKKKKKEKEKSTTRETPKPKPFLPAPVSGARTLLDFNPTEVARQISLLEMAQYRRIRPWELLNQSWTKEDKGAENVREMIAWSTRMSQLISTEVIKVPIKTKTAMISHCIQIGAELMKLNNYNGVMSILAGFSNSAVNRLQPFFREVPKKDTKTLKELRAALSSDKNFRAMRDRIKTSEPPVLPYLGTFLTDLTFIEDGNSDRLNDLVNFKKCRLQSQVIRLLQQYQQIGYHLETVQEITDYLQTGMIMDNKVLYKVSLKHLPREAKEVSVRELERLKKDASKTGSSSSGDMSVQYCRGTMTIEDVVSAIENDDELTMVSLCRQHVSKEDMEKVALLLSTHSNVHTLRLCHGAFAERSSKDSWKWLKNARHIKTLDLSNQDLGFIPDEVAYMDELTSLFLQYNQIDNIPRGIGYLQKLEELKCEGNKIKEIPECLEDCKKLRSFNISANKLTSLPDFLGWLSELRYFYCNDNEIKSIPAEILQKGGVELLGHLRGGASAPVDGKPMGLGFG